MYCKQQKKKCLFSSIPFPEISFEPTTLEGRIRLSAARSFECPTADPFLGEEWTKLNLDDPVVQASLFTKPLEHNLVDGALTATGVAELKKLASYIESLKKANISDYYADLSLDILKTIVLAPGSTTKYVDLPCSALVTMEGGFQKCFSLPPPPALSSDEAGLEMVQLYGMMLLRNAPFPVWDRLLNSEIAGSALTVAQKADMTQLILELNANLSLYNDATDPQDGDQVSPAVLFRAPYTSSLAGPYISQFLMHPTTWGASTMSNQYLLPQFLAPGPNYFTTKAAMLSAQNGIIEMPIVIPQVYRYITTPYDMSIVVQSDPIYQLFLQASLLLNQWKVPINPGWAAIASPTNNVSFVAGGSFPNATALLAQVADLALVVAWFYKWRVCLRLRPDTFSLWVQNVLDGTSPSNPFSLSDIVLNSTLVNNLSVYVLNSSYFNLNPQHPSYVSGHSIIAGACITVLKAIYDGSTTWASIPTSPIAVQSDVANDGESTTSVGVDSTNMTINGELNKLADNQGKGRMIAGIHYESDHLAGVALGEQVAIQFLRNHLSMYPARHSLEITIKTVDDQDVILKAAML